MEEIKILILCRGNITRSPFIAGYLHHLYRNSDIAEKIYLDIDSSGIEGKINRPVHPLVLEKGYELGFDLAMYRSKHSSLASLEKADIIIVTDRKQLARFEKHYQHLLFKVFHISAFGAEGDFEIKDIKDPSHSRIIDAFTTFFEHAIPDVQRIWRFIENEYEKTESENRQFNKDIFLSKVASSKPIAKKYNFFTKRMYPLCPYCQSKRIRRSRRKNFFQKSILPIFNGYPYHCGSCNRDVILFVDAQINSQRRREEKQQKWNNFIQAELAYQRNATDLSPNRIKRNIRKSREVGS